MPIHTIAIIGAGVPGRAIAQIALRVGYRVVLEDFSRRTLEEAEASIRESLGEKLAEHADKYPSSDQLRNLSVCIGIEEAIRDANLIIETAADELETKLELFTIFDKFARPGAIFATTSTAHPVAEISDVTACPERCVTLRFAPADNPTQLAVVPGRQTSPDTLTHCAEFAQRLRIEVNVTPKLFPQINQNPKTSSQPATDQPGEPGSGGAMASGSGSGGGSRGSSGPIGGMSGLGGCGTGSSGLGGRGLGPSGCGVPGSGSRDCRDSIFARLEKIAGQIGF